MLRQIDWIAGCGLTMLVAGGAMVFSPYKTLPLWAIWLLGPLLWYLGFAVTVAGIAAHFFFAGSRRERGEHRVPVSRLERIGRAESPEGILGEIPSLGGFFS